MTRGFERGAAAELPGGIPLPSSARVADNAVQWTCRRRVPATSGIRLVSVQTRISARGLTAPFPGRHAPERVAPSLCHLALHPSQRPRRRGGHLGQPGMQGISPCCRANEPVGSRHGDRILRGHFRFSRSSFFRATAFRTSVVRASVVRAGVSRRAIARSSASRSSASRSSASRRRALRSVSDRHVPVRRIVLCRVVVRSVLVRCVPSRASVSFGPLDAAHD